MSPTWATFAGFIWENSGFPDRGPANMKCEGCGAELQANAAKCAGCGREVGLGTRAAGETVHVGKEAGAVAEKAGKSVWGAVKKVGSATKKEFEHHDSEQKQ